MVGWLARLNIERRRLLACGFKDQFAPTAAVKGETSHLRPPAHPNSGALPDLSHLPSYLPAIYHREFTRQQPQFSINCYFTPNSTTQCDCNSTGSPAHAPTFATNAVRYICRKLNTATFAVSVVFRKVLCAILHSHSGAAQHCCLGIRRETSDTISTSPLHQAFSFLVELTSRMKQNEVTSRWSSPVISANIDP